MSSISTEDIKREFTRSVLGMTGIAIITSLIIISIIATVTIPASTFQEWNNPEKWLTYPKTSIPIWVNYFTSEKIPEHKIIEPRIINSESDNTYLTSQQFPVNFEFDDFPSDFVYEFETKYSDSYLLTVSLLRPDEKEINLISTSLPFSENETVYKQRIFSTDEMIKKNIRMESEMFAFDVSDKNLTNVIFSETSENKVLKGDYTFIINTFFLI